MKKLVLLMAVMFSMAFVSCTGNADKTAVKNDTVQVDTTQVDTTQVVDSVTVDSVK